MTTPQQTFATLISELSASGSKPINASTEGHPSNDKTLREAVGLAYWKTNALLPLNDRPRDVKEWDDLFGHILSMRAEQLVTQAILANLAAKLGVDVNAVRDATLKGLDS